MHRGIHRGDIDADPSAERLWTSATVVTVVRTVVSLALCLAAARSQDLTLLVAGLAVYWVGDMLDGAVARWRGCETRIGAVVDVLSDRLNAVGFYVGLVWLRPETAVPVGVYLFEFLVVDAFLTLAFLAWSVRSPNYFYAVDRRIWLWNWSKPGKAVNSAAFAVLLLVTSSPWVGAVVAVALLVLKCVSLGWLLRIGLPIPAAPAVAAEPADATPAA
ncbi:CDP-alcohol phosphatidyltransferase family protein [Xylanimonas protaetiae]|uniref:CDP-alcohol phosphatidyltransferase family protein n=1 Tax=Xylanimonas protaetiae TaxID=2509457 RepID=A0A4P6F5G6_9MICO|nr:CDP-alcohol phosphatidyltransferase family protein [Xylanimonas protaetiae]QAY70605.1 CDP-alcohol phosphatidyltransferase family protein [Xylanimonas protaetiae]